MQRMKHQHHVQVEHHGIVTTQACLIRAVHSSHVGAAIAIARVLGSSASAAVNMAVPARTMGFALCLPFVGHFSGTVFVYHFTDKIMV